VIFGVYLYGQLATLEEGLKYPVESLKRMDHRVKEGTEVSKKRRGLFFYEIILICNRHYEER